MLSVDTDIKDLRMQLADTIYAPDVFTAVENNRLYLRQWLPWVDQTQSIQDSKNFLTYCKQGYASQTQATLLLFYKKTFIGTLAYNSLDHVNHIGEIGYWMIEKYQGNGLMTHAVKALIDIGFNRLGLNRIVIKVAPGNKSSQALAKRLGFNHEGTARQSALLHGEFIDLEIYSSIKNERPTT